MPRLRIAALPAAASLDPDRTSTPFARGLATPIHPSSWKGFSEKFGCPIGSGFIHITESLCATTTCSPNPYGVRGPRSHLRALRAAFYARSCKRTSENSTSTHSGA
jgi:hypothetical protein